MARTRTRKSAVAQDGPYLTPLQRGLLDWFEAHQRDLPWRGAYRPYEVWISEIMLQQTQMDRAVAYFVRFMTQFPDVNALAAAEEDAVLKAWEGLGYYSRARNLHAAAKRIVEEHHGEFPADPEVVRALPGVGRYTAGAILSQAFQLDEPAVDANVERVLARLFDVDDPVKSSQAQQFFWETARSLIPPGRAREFNQALMEFGALVCGKRPACMTCPLTEHCEAHYLGVVEHRPVPAKRKPPTPLATSTGVLVHRGRVFIQRRPEDKVWGGLWEFPGGGQEPDETAEQCVTREFAEELDWRVRVEEKIAVIRHGYTTFKVTLSAYLLRFAEDDLGGAALQEDMPAPTLRAADEGRWVRFEELSTYAFPAGHRKLIDQMTRDLRYAWLTG